MIGGIGDGVIVVIACCVGMTFETTDGVATAIAIDRQQMFVMSSGREIVLVAVAARTTQTAVLIPIGCVHDQIIGTGIAVAVATDTGTCAS